MCLAPLQPTSVAPGTCARSALRFFSFELRKRTAMRFRSHHKVQRATPFANPAKNFAVPPKRHVHKLGSNQPRVFVPKHSRAEKEKTYEPQSAFDHWIYRQERRNQVPA